MAVNIGALSIVIVECMRGFKAEFFSNAYYRSEKKQAAYDAAVILDDTGGKYINFKLEFPKRKEGVNGRK